LEASASGKKDPASILAGVLNLHKEVSNIVVVFKAFDRKLFSVKEGSGVFKDSVKVPAGNSSKEVPENQAADIYLENSILAGVEKKNEPFMVRDDSIVLFSRAISQLCAYDLIRVVDSEICKKF
jgi:hypothetical protein